MLKIIFYMCVLYLNFLESTCSEPNEDLVLTVDGVKLTNWLIERIKDKDPYKNLYTNYTIFQEKPIDITCESRNELYNVSLFYNNQKMGKKKCSDKQNCTKISINLTPGPGSSLTCKSIHNNTELKNLVLYFSRKLPNVTIKINGTVKTAGSNETDTLYYFYDNNEVIKAECVHKTNKTPHTGQWNIHDFEKKNGDVLVNDFTIGGQLTVIKLSNVNGWYIDCQDTSVCHPSSCKPPFIRLKFILRSNGLKPEVSAEILKITGLKDGNKREINETHVEYKFKQGEELQLECSTNFRRPKKLTWYKNDIKINSDSKNELVQDFHLNKEDHLITCSFDETVNENAGPRHENRTILLLYEEFPTTTTSTTTTTITTTQVAVTGQTEITSTPGTIFEPQTLVLNSNTLIIASCVIFAIIIIIIILIYIIIKQSRKRNNSEGHRHLYTANSSIKSQSTESISKLDATYSCPRDTTHRNGLQDPTINCNVYQSDTYSVPFTETRDVYSVPMPKKFRSLKTPTKEDKLSNNKYYTYAKTYQNGYSNVGPQSTNIKEYENLKNDLIHEAPSDYYSEVNN